jgi:hypothetical protein
VSAAELVVGPLWHTHQSVIDPREIAVVHAAWRSAPAIPVATYGFYLALLAGGSPVPAVGTLPRTNGTRGALALASPTLNTTDEWVFVGLTHTTQIPLVALEPGAWHSHAVVLWHLLAPVLGVPGWGWGTGDAR